MKRLNAALNDWTIDILLTNAGTEALKAKDDLLIPGVYGDLLRAQVPPRQN